MESTQGHIPTGHSCTQWEGAPLSLHITAHSDTQSSDTCVRLISFQISAAVRKEMFKMFLSHNDNIIEYFETSC